MCSPAGAVNAVPGQPHGVGADGLPRHAAAGCLLHAPDGGLLGGGEPLQGGAGAGGGEGDGVRDGGGERGQRPGGQRHRGRALQPAGAQPSLASVVPEEKLTNRHFLFMEAVPGECVSIYSVVISCNDGRQ